MSLSGLAIDTAEDKLDVCEIVTVTNQGVIQDFVVEGGNEKSNQKMLLKKGQLLFQYPAMDTQSSLKGGGNEARGISPFPPYDTLLI